LNPYPKGVHDNPNVVTDSKMLVQSLASSINEKGDLAIKQEIPTNRYRVGNEIREEIFG
jgi:hypothetical protein